MATVSKNFRVKDGLIVEGSVGTINGSNILTEDATQVLNNKTLGTNLNADNNSITSLAAPVNPLDATNKQYVDGLDLAINEKVDDLDLAINAKVDALTTADIAEDPGFLYFTTQRAIDAVGGAATPNNTPLTVVKRDENGAFAAGIITAESVNASVDLTAPEVLTPVVTVENSSNVAVGSLSGLGSDLKIDSTASLDVTASTNVTLTADADVTVTADSDVIITAVNGDVVLDPLSGVARVNGDTIVTETAAQTVTNKVIGSGTTLGADLNADSYKVINVGTPTQPLDAANKAYVDSVAEGLHVHASVAAATTTDINLGVGGLLVIDGVQLVAGDRVLVKDQTDPSENGIYLASAGAWTRAEDYNTAAEIQGGDFTFVTGGTLYNSTGWVQLDKVTTLGTDPIEFQQFSGAGTYTAGVGLDLNGTEFVLDLSEVSTTTLPEGDNKYYTDERVDDRVAALVQGGQGITVNYDDDGNILSLSTEFSEFTTSDIVEGDKLFFTNQRAYDAINDSSTINFVEVDINSIAKQVAATTTSLGSVAATVYQWPKADHRSAKFLVKIDNGTHNEVSEVLLTLDAADNIAITEYAIVGTNGSRGTISADINSGNVRLVVNPVNDSTITVTGTLLA